jgi:hypothetical protein
VLTLHICWKILAAALTLYLISMVSGFVLDIEARLPVVRD